MPYPPNVKRIHDGADVRLFPATGLPYKKKDPNEFHQQLLPDDDADDIREAETAKPEEVMPGEKPVPEEAGTAKPEEALPVKRPVPEALVTHLVPVPSCDDLCAGVADEAEAPEPFSVCVVGAGAIGCHLAYVLQKAGNDVTFLARGENLRALQTTGLQLTICGEDVGPVRIRATDRPDEVGVVDYVFLTMKVGGYDSTVAEMIQPLIGPSTAILPPTTSIPYWWFYKMKGPLLDRRLGRVDPRGSLWELLPPQQVIGFTMWLSAVQVGPGQVVVRHVQRGYPVGELDGSSSARTDRLAAALELGGIAAPRDHDIRAEIFIKAVNSLAFNVVAVLGNAQNGLIADEPGAVEALHNIMEECEAIARALAIPIFQSAESRIRQTLSARMHTMSMLNDLRKGKQLELGSLWASFEDLAEVTGVKLPLTRALVGVALLRERAEQHHRSEAEMAVAK